MATTIVKKDKTYKKRYKCPYCESRLEREQMPKHIDKYHSELIPEGYTSTRIAFNTINKKTEGHCIICGGISPWNEEKKRYERLCEKKSCHDKYVKMVDERLKNKRGVTKTEMLSDPEFQDKMLKSRSISGTYKFSDGTSIPYVGTYEKNFLEFMDNFLHVSAEDIQAPGPTIEYYYEGKKHFWITDFYYIPYNLVLDIKDGGDNPNNRNMPEYRAKQVAKEKAIISGNVYNYIRLTDNKFEQLIEMFLDLKDSLVEMDTEYTSDMKKHTTVKINESVSSVNEVLLESDLVQVLQSLLNSPSTYIEKDLSPIRKIVESYSTDQLKDNIVYLDSALRECTTRVDEYSKYIRSGKCSWDYQLQCEALKSSNISISDLNEVTDQIKGITYGARKRLDVGESSVYEEMTEFDKMYLNLFV
jgi:hypothetical protein